MANAYQALKGSTPVQGQYNAGGRSGYPLLPMMPIYYQWNTAIGAALTAGQFGNLFGAGVGQILPGGGLWKVELWVNVAALGSETAAEIALSLFTDNTTTDHVLGDNDLQLGQTAAAVASGYVQSLVYGAADFTVYPKAKLTGAVGNVITGKLLATKLFDI